MTPGGRGEPGQTRRTPVPVPVKRHRGEPGHTRDTHAHTRTHGSHRRTTQYSTGVFLRLLSPAAEFRPSRGRAGFSLGLDGCEVRLCDPCARVRPCVPCVSRLPPVSFYRYCKSLVMFAQPYARGRSQHSHEDSIHTARIGICGKICRRFAAQYGVICTTCNSLASTCQLPVQYAHSRSSRELTGPFCASPA